MNLFRRILRRFRRLLSRKPVGSSGSSGSAGVRARMIIQRRILEEKERVERERMARRTSSGSSGSSGRVGEATTIT